MRVRKGERIWFDDGRIGGVVLRAGVMIARGDLAVECGYERMAEARGFAPGQEFDDWLAAERMLAQQPDSSGN